MPNFSTFPFAVSAWDHQSLSPGLLRGQIQYRYSQTLQGISLHQPALPLPPSSLLQKELFEEKVNLAMQPGLSGMDIFEAPQELWELHSSSTPLGVMVQAQPDEFWGTRETSFNNPNWKSHLSSPEKRDKSSTSKVLQKPRHTENFLLQVANPLF